MSGVRGGRKSFIKSVAKIVAKKTIEYPGFTLFDFFCVRNVKVSVRNVKVYFGSAI